VESHLVGDDLLLRLDRNIVYVVADGGVRLFDDGDPQYEPVLRLLIEIDDLDIGVADISIGVVEVNLEGYVETNRDGAGLRVDD